MARVGASQVFFNVVAQWNTEKLISDTRTASNVMQAVLVDSFEAVLKPIDDMNLLLDQGIEAIRGITEATNLASVEFEKFYGEVEDGSGELEMMERRLITVGEEFATMGDEALSAGARAAQVGTLIGRQNVDILVRQANVLSQISDFDAPAAMKALIALQQQTNALYGDMSRDEFSALTFTDQRVMLEENLMAMNNTLNTVANNSVALESDLVESMRNFAAQGHLVGDSFAEMAAMSAVLLEAGEEQGASGRALRMMYARLGGDISGARTKMEQMNVAILDENGNMKSMTEIMTALHEQGFSELSAARKQEIAQIVAGNRHYVRFLKLMENHSRFTELAALGEEGLADATDQATKAMQDLANQLLKVEAQSENARAALGARMLPMMIGMEEATRDTLESLDLMAGAFGKMFGDKGGEKVSKGLGRMIGGFRQMQGFVKFGLTIRSLGIASEMYQSVQRSLNDILVANENLHSKTATYLRFGEKANEHQQTLAKRIRFQHQEIAKVLEFKRMLQTQIKVTEQARVPVLEAQKRVLEATEDLDEKAIQHSVAQQRMKAQYLTVLKRVNSEVMLEAEGVSKLGQAMQSIYGSGKGTTRNDAFMRQTAMDIEMVKRLSKSQKELIITQQERGRQQHTMMQRMKTFNEITRAFEFAQLDNNEKLRTNARLLKMSGEEIKILGSGYAHYVQRLGDAQDRASKTKELLEVFAKVLRTNKIEGDEFNATMIQQAQAMGLNAKETRGMLDALEEHSRITGLTDPQQKANVAAMKKMFGEISHFDNITKAMASADSFGEVGRQLHMLTMEMDEASLEALDARTAMMDLEKALDDAGMGTSQYTELLRELQLTEMDEMEQKQKLIQLTKMMTDENIDLQQAVQKYKDEMEETQKKQLSLQKSVDKNIGALSFGLSNLIGTSLFALGKTEAAMGSVLMFTSSMVPAISQVTKSIQGMTADLMAMDKAAKVTVLSTTALRAAMIGLVAGVGFGIVKFQQKANEMQEAAQLATQAAQQAQSVLSADTQVSENKGLVAALDLTTKSFGELHGDLPAINAQIAILEGSLADLSGSNKESAETALTNLKALRALSTEGAVMLDEAAFEAAAAEMRQTGIGELLASGRNISNRQMRAFGEELGVEFADGIFKSNRHDMKRLMDGIVNNMREGTKLTADQLETAEGMFSKATFELISQMNELVISSLDGEIAAANLEKSIADAANSIGTLTDELADANRELFEFGDAKEELFFGGKFGNVTGSLYKQVVQKGVESLYVTNEVIMTNNFNGFFNEEEAARRIINVLNRHLEGQV